MNAALQLLITLVGVTFLFGCLQENGTLERVVGQALRFCSGRARLLSPMFFLVAAATSTVGPGGVLATALIAPVAMRAGTLVGLSPFLISVMVCHGAMAGFLSPFSTTGAVAALLMQGAGLGGHEYRVWFFEAAAHALVASAAYVLLGGLTPKSSSQAMPAMARMKRPHWLTICVTGVWIVLAVTLSVPLGWSALVAAVLLIAMRIASPTNAIKLMPWKVIALVVTISSLVGLVERTGALEGLKDALTWIATPISVHAVLAFFAGLISAFASTSAVVLPALLPLVPGMAARFAGVHPLALSTSLLIGATLVDVSPLSTVGALCVAAAPPGKVSSDLFRKLLLWGLSMAFVGAAICYVMSPLFGPR